MQHHDPQIGGYDQELLTYARAVGLHRVGVCDTAVLDRARREIIRRRVEGLADTMQFTFRNPQRSTDPGRTLAGAASLIVGARRYVDEADTDVDQRPVNSARVARYARADHYAALRTSLDLVADRLRHDGYAAAVFVDENDLVDREVAYKAGLGWFGKSANILVPGGGSWYVLGSVVTTARLEPTARRVPDGCGSCRVCIDACPTGAIVADGVIDARRCLAWLVQKAGVFPFEYRIDLGDRLYGCDDCQETCPPNVRFRHRVAAPVGDSPPVSDADVDLFEVLEAEDSTLMDRFGRWYIAGRDPIWLRRNALIILGNVAPVPVSDRVRRTVERFLAHPDPHLRSQTVWTAARLGLAEVVDSVRDDGHPLVVAELARWDDIPSRVPSESST